MTPNSNILQELKELESSLVGLAAQNIYSVPDGYFEGLASQVLNRIKAMEATNAAEELGYLSPMLSNIANKKLPYTVPVGYFEGLEERLMQTVRDSNDYLHKESFGQTATEELETLSPLLSGLKKEMPYSMPQGYFENLATDINVQVNKPETKVVSMGSSKWFRYAAAAMVIGVIATLSFMLLNKDKVTADKDSYAWVKKNIKKVSTEKIEEFIQLTDEDKSVASIDTKIEDVKELVKDVPENEIQSLLNDTELLDDVNSDENISDEAIMN
jgi:hypothetical protein